MLAIVIQSKRERIKEQANFDHCHWRNTHPEGERKIFLFLIQLKYEFEYREIQLVSR